MPDWLRFGAGYLIGQPGTQFHFYLPIVLSSVALLCIPAYHYLLAAGERFRRFPVHHHMLDRLCLWLTGIAGAWLLLMLFRYANLPVLSWRIWLGIVVVASAVLYMWGIFWVYRRGPQLLENYEAELQRKRYLAGATPTVPALVRRARKTAKQR